MVGSIVIPRQFVSTTPHRSLLQIYYSLYVWTPPLMFTYGPVSRKILDSAKTHSIFPIWPVMFNCSIQVTVLLSCLPWWIPNWCSCFGCWEVGTFSIRILVEFMMVEWNWPHEMKMTLWFIWGEYRKGGPNFHFAGFFVCRLSIKTLLPETVLFIKYGGWQIKALIADANTKGGRRRRESLCGAVFNL